jgi:hypothetical protein
MSPARMQSATPYAPAARSAQLAVATGLRAGTEKAEQLPNWRSKAPMQVLPLPLHLLLIPRNRFATNGESSTTASSTLFGCAKPFFLGGAIAGRNLFVHTEDEVAPGATAGPAEAATTARHQARGGFERPSLVSNATTRSTLTTQLGSSVVGPTPEATGNGNLSLSLQCGTLSTRTPEVAVQKQ